jgi:purine-binding chemotaxis protein CheW
MERQFCTFYLDEIYYGISVESIQEILQDQIVKEVPLSSPVVKGLINLRGQIISILDMRKILGLSPKSAELNSILVCYTEHGLVGFLIEEVDDVVYLDSEYEESPPGSLEGAVKDLIQSVFKRKTGLLLNIAIQKASDLAFTNHYN